MLQEDVIEDHLLLLAALITSSSLAGKNERKCVIRGVTDEIMHPGIDSGEGTGKKNLIR